MKTLLKIIIAMGVLLVLRPPAANSQSRYGIPNAVPDTGFLRILSNGRAVALSASQLATLLGSGTIADNSVTFAKMQDIGTDLLIGRDAAGTGDPTAISLDASLGWTGSNSIQRAALTGDVTAAAGSNTTAIASGVIVDGDINASAGIVLSKLATQAALSVVTNATNSTAVPTAVAAVSDGQVFRRSGTALGFGTVATAGVADGAITNAKIADMNVSKLLSGTLPSGFIFTVPAASATRFDYVGGNPAITVSTTANETSLFSQNGSQYLSANNANVLIGAGVSKMEFSSGGLLDLFDSDATHKITLKTPPTASLTSNVTIALPSGLGSSGQAVVTDGAGQWSYATVGGGGSLSEIEPSELTADQDNYNPSGFDTATDVFISSDANFREITGFGNGAGANSGRRVTFRVVGSYPVGFLPNHTGSSAENRMRFPYPILIYPGNSISFAYYDTDSRWVMTGSSKEVNQGRVNYYEMTPSSITAADHAVWAAALSTGTWSTLTTSSTVPSSGWQLTTGASATGSANIYGPKTITLAGWMSKGWVMFTATVQLGAVSNGTDRFTAGIRIGGATASPGHALGNNVGLRCTDNVNSGNWQAYTRDGSSAETTLDSGVAASTNPVTLTVNLNYLNTKARFYVNGSFVGEITTNMPGTTGWGMSNSILKSVGTTSRSMGILSMKCEHHF